MSRRAWALFARKGVETVCALIAFSFIARVLTKEQFAAYSLVLAYVAILQLSALPGLGAATAQSFSRGIRGTFRRAAALSFLGSLVGAVALATAGAWYFSRDDVELAHAFLVAAPCFPLAAGLTLWRSAVLGEERYSRFLFFDSVSSILRCGSIIFLTLLFGGHVFLIVAATLLAPALINAVATLDQLRHVRADEAQEQASIEYGLQTTVYQLPTVIVQQLDKLALFYLISPEVMAVYVVALKIPDLARDVVADANATLAPVFARESDYSRPLHAFTIKLWLFYSAISIAGAVFVVPYLLPILVGDDYADAVLYAQLMTVGAALGYLGNIQFRYIRSHLHGRNFRNILISKALIDALLILPLAYFFALEGVVAAYMLKHLAMTLIVSVVIRRMYLRT